MASNQFFGGLRDEATRVRNYSTTAVTGSTAAIVNDGEGVRWIDMGEGSPVGQGGREIARVMAAVELEVTDWADGTNGVMDLQIVYSSDGSTTAETNTITRYSGEAETAWREFVPFTNQYQGTVYRYVGIQVKPSAADQTVKLGFNVIRLM